MQRPDPGRAPCARKPCAGGQIGAGAAGEGALILGAVLAGGASSRFGSDKAAAMLAGRTLLDRAGAAIAPHVDRVVVVGRGAIADRPRPGLGPMGGIAGALAFAKREGYARVVTIGCDMPLLPDELVEALLRHAPSYCSQAPILGHWPVSALDDALALLQDRSGKGPSIRAWCARIGAVPIVPAAPIANVNTPADLAAL